MQKKTSVISIVNQKGGVGKTTSVVNLAAAYSLLNKKVLVIDLDYQANTTSHLGINPEQLKSIKNITHILENEKLPIEEAITKTKYQNIDCIASDQSLSILADRFTGQANQFALLKPIIDSTSLEKYDIVLIDNHPSIDCFFQSALTSSHYYLIPLFPEEHSIQGLGHQIQQAEKIIKYLNPMLTFLGCIITNYNKHNATHRKTEQQLRKLTKAAHFRVFDSIIPYSNHVSAAATQGTPIHFYRPNSEIASAYSSLAGEILPHLKGKRQGRKVNIPKYDLLEKAENDDEISVATTI